MKSFVTICVLASMAVAINAYANKPPQNDAFLPCAMDKFSRMFVNITYIEGSRACLYYETSQPADNARAIIDIISEDIDENEAFYASEPDTLEKYEKLYDFTTRVLANDEKIRDEVANLNETTQQCIAFELMKATRRISDARVCFD